MDSNLLTLAENGDREAQYKVVMAYHNGDGVEKNDSEAASWFSKSLEQNYPAAYGMVGEFYMQGIAVAQDVKLAASLFSQGAELGDIHSKYRLGWVYWNTSSYSEAIPYLKEAADGGSAPAKCLLAKCYFNGNGVSEDKTKGLALFEEAACDGDAEAQYMAGFCYGFGYGAEVDVNKAYGYTKQSVDQGHKDAIKNLNIFEKALEDPKAYMERVKAVRHQGNQPEKPASNPEFAKEVQSYEPSKASQPSDKKRGSRGLAILLLVLFVPVGIWYLVTHEM